MVIDELKKYDSFVIFGAQVIAYGAYVAICELTGRVPECFAVGTMEGNPDEIEGIPVLSIEKVPQNKFVVVGVTELVQKDVIPFLQEGGYGHIFALTQHEEHLLMSAYYTRIGKFPLADAKLIELLEVPELVMFEVKTHRDKKLSFQPKLFDWERPIQAGATLTTERVTELTDATGCNISHKNKQYCEMSATYWVWKNTDYAWTGIEHYRRHLLVKPELLTEEVDVLLPLPYICYPHEIAQFRRFVSQDVLDTLLRTLQDLHPKQYQIYHSILYGKYQYTYNMLCARREVFEDYCQWFFEITENMEKVGDKVPEIRDTRALSYVAEVLTNLYFMSNERNWKIRHVEKEIYT